MNRPASALVGATAFLSIAATPLVAQSITGVEVAQKPRAGAGPGALPAGVAWTGWSADEVVARFVQQPIKVLDLMAMPPDARVDVKRLMGRADIGVRTLVDAMHEGTVDTPKARIALDRILVEYHRLLQELEDR